jgi:hypothetical protein
MSGEGRWKGAKKVYNSQKWWYGIRKRQVGMGRM